MFNFGFILGHLIRIIFGQYKMDYRRAKFILWFGLTTLAVGMLIGCKDKPQPEPNNTVQQQKAEPNTVVKPVAKPISNPRPTLNDIITKRRGWSPAFIKWFGREAPDFTVTDLAGKKHTLSEYRGKDVMLNFWATWCRPCLMEIPHLIALRKTIGEDKLAIIAISCLGPMNSAETVKEFVAANPIINYTVTATDTMTMPKPYNLVNGIPCTFFIDPQGRIKLATEGLIPPSDIRAIIEAER
jgi:thiol-disulfide isomerase/thioredoxin